MYIKDYCIHDRLCRFVEVQGERMEVSHLLFADDTLVFYGFLGSNDLFKLVPYVA